MVRFTSMCSVTLLAFGGRCFARGLTATCRVLQRQVPPHCPVECALADSGRLIAPRIPWTIIARSTIHSTHRCQSGCSRPDPAVERTAQLVCCCLTFSGRRSSAGSWQAPHLWQRLGDVFQAAGDGAEVRAVVHGRAPALCDQVLESRWHRLLEPAGRRQQICHGVGEITCSAP